MIAILDYGSGNIRSAQRACEGNSHDVVITSDYQTAVDADGLVIPGVGAFGACMKGLLAVRGDEIIKRRILEKRKILGICVGMQILFEDSEEQYEGSTPRGVGIFPGSIRKLAAPVLPHIGWNQMTVNTDSTSFAGIENERFYFVHSYAAVLPVAGAMNAIAHYGDDFLAAVETDVVTAVQFHPEKSGQAGLALISNWAASL